MGGIVVMGCMDHSAACFDDRSTQAGIRQGFAGDHDSRTSGLARIGIRAGTSKSRTYGEPGRNVASKPRAALNREAASGNSSLMRNLSGPSIW